MSRIKLYTKNFVILFISMQLVNLMIVYFKTKQFVFEITSVQAFIIRDCRKKNKNFITN